MEGRSKNSVYFDNFEIDLERRRLLRDGEMVALKSKAFDLLVALAENRGELLSKDRLFEMVWADQIVEENNLTVHIAALRKALGEKRGEHRFIVTVPGKGYRFIGEVEAAEMTELTVETHRIQRITIEESIHESAEPAAAEAQWEGESISTVATTRAALAAGTQKRSGRLWVAAPVALICIAAAWVGFRNIAPGRTPFAQTSIGTFAVAGGIPHRVAISADGKTIAYVRREKGRDSIWIGDLASNSSTRITTDSIRLHNQLAFSPDGRTLFFTARDESYPEWTLMSMPIYGGAPRVHATGTSSFSLSPDGASLAYLKVIGERSILAVTNAESGGERILFEPAQPIKFASTSVSWSPDGRSVTVGLSDEAGNGCQFVRIDADSGHSQKFGENLCVGSTEFTWLKDGSGIVMAAKTEEDEITQIWHVEYPGGSRRRIIDDRSEFSPVVLSTSSGGRIAGLLRRNYANIVYRPLSGARDANRILLGAAQGEGSHGLWIAPDGKILFTVRVKGSLSIWEMGADGSNMRQLIANESGRDDVRPVVSPDGRYVVFESARTGVTEIWRADRDGSNPTQLTNGGGNIAPSFDPAGRNIYYTVRRDGVDRIWRIPADGGKEDQVTGENCAWPDISPSGYLLACAVDIRSTVARKLLVFDIKGELLHSFDVPITAALYNRLRWTPDGKAIIYKDVVEGLWRQELSGGEPVKLPSTGDERVFHFTFTSGGDLLYSGGTQMREIIFIDDLENVN